VGCVCNNAEIRNETLYGQPTEGALLALAMKMDMHDTRSKYTRTLEIPFSSDNKWMAVKCQPLKNNVTQEVYFMKGALERVLNQCKTFNNYGTPATLTVKRLEMFAEEAKMFGRSGLRVLAMAVGTDMNALTFVGMVGIIDPPRPGVIESIHTLLGTGVSIKMVTGDAEETAVAIGER
ncbi:calcium-transporting ATPase type 2C member 2-like, partial [Saccoglossus kowalevskii]